MLKALRICALFIIVTGLVNFSFAQNSTIKKNEDLAELKVENLKIRAQGIEGLFAEISFSLDVPIGIETGPEADPLTEYKIDFKGGKLSVLLDEAVNLVNQKQKQYSWRMAEGVINISPDEIYREKAIASLLETRIDSFAIKEGTSCASFAASIFETREIRDVLEANSPTFRRQNPGGFYFPQLGEKFTLVFSNTTLKSALNKVIKESPITRIWFIRRNFHHPESVTLGLSAWHEGLPIENRTQIKALFSEDEF
jgi:hypothetical protein